MGMSPFQVNQVNDTNVQQHAKAYLKDWSILTYDTTLITFTNMHSVISQKSWIFINTVAITSNLTQYTLFVHILICFPWTWVYFLQFFTSCMEAKWNFWHRSGDWFTYEISKLESNWFTYEISKFESNSSISTQSAIQPLTYVSNLNNSIMTLLYEV